MTYHAAYALPTDLLDIVLIEDSKPMQAILRSIIGGLKPRRVRTFDRADEALEAMLHEPPNLIITDWRMEPMSGAMFLKTIRDKRMSPLCFVPVIVVTAHATRQVVERAMYSGAHSLLVKPLAPAMLLDRVQRLCEDQRRFVLDHDGGAYEIEGVRKVLAVQQARTDALLKAREYHEAALRQIETEEGGEHKVDPATAEVANKIVVANRRTAAKASTLPASTHRYAAIRVPNT
ncbi:response regulator [Chthonobacter albigriseus]|uniref:response regulator n=1 Tax=Chthonobacter albigriseus TaxID=1683161 RepID=UPI0015EF87FA|nr:response regulator [Chthonobacter albigriseus]